MPPTLEEVQLQSDKTLEHVAQVVEEAGYPFAAEYFRSLKSDFLGHCATHALECEKGKDGN